MIYLVGFLLLALLAGYLSYTIYHFVLLDAHCRHIDKPRFWSLLAASGQRGEGLLVYLIHRNSHPLTASHQELLLLKAQKHKIKILLGLAFLCAAGLLLWLFATT